MFCSDYLQLLFFSPFWMFVWLLVHIFLGSVCGVSSFSLQEMDAKCDDTGCKTPANWQKPGAKLPIMGDESIMKPKVMLS